MEKIDYTITNQKKARVTMLISVTEDFRIQKVIRDRERCGEYPPSVRWLTEVRRAMGQRNTPSYALH